VARCGVRGPAVLLVDGRVGGDAVQVVQKGAGEGVVDPGEGVVAAGEGADVVDVGVDGYGVDGVDLRGADDLDVPESLVAEARFPSGGGGLAVEEIAVGLCVAVGEHVV
jgi:hypothetical protein